MTQQDLDVVGAPLPRTRKVRIVAQDPLVRGRDGAILTAVVDIPEERCAPGPHGYRVHVVDYDASAGVIYSPFTLGEGRSAKDWAADPAGAVGDAEILGDPRFHAQNTYALVMRTLWRFEFALGRRISWGFRDPSHQLKVAPHAFSDANAFYSRRDESMLFGYFPTREGDRRVFTCLSHDIVAHETAHAVLDGLRERFMEPSSPDQAGFHEGFADIVAILSVFSLPEVIESLMDVHLEPTEGHRKKRGPRAPEGMMNKEDADAEELRRSVVFALGKQFGRESSVMGRGPLRHSLGIQPSPALYDSDEFLEPHRRGELLVAAVLDAFIEVWAARLEAYFVDHHAKFIDRVRAAEEGSRAADYLLTMCIRAIDYCPPVHLLFGTYLSALLTADKQVNPRDPFRFREHLRGSFAKFGIVPASSKPNGKPSDDGAWLPPLVASSRKKGAYELLNLSYDRARFESMQRDRDEVFKFVWENRKELSLIDEAFTKVLSVRPCVRVAPEDGFHVRETVAEVLQQVVLRADELPRHGIAIPDDMPPTLLVTLFGGVTLVFDEYGRVKYAVGDRLLDPNRHSVQVRQALRLETLWKHGALSPADTPARRFAALHRLRAVDPGTSRREEW